MNTSRRVRIIAVAVAAAGAIVALAQSTYTFTVNGKKVALETVEKNGKVFVDAQAAFKALGASVTYDKAKRSFVVVTAGQNSKPAVQGTAQLAGSDAQLDKAYSVGNGTNALNFTRKSAEFTVARVNVGQNVYAPDANEKLLVLHYTVQNPQKSDMPFSDASFKITVVDAKNVNHPFEGYVGREDGGDQLYVELKPAQKIDAYLAITVPGAGSVPKLIVERNDGSPVLRYDLRGKVKPLAAPFADPADSSGSTARVEVPAEAGKAYPLKTFDVKLESVAYTAQAIGGAAPEDGRRYLVATFSIRNAAGKTNGPEYWSESRFAFELGDAEGDRRQFDDYLLKAARDERADGELRPGQEARFRVYFELPADLAAKTLSVKEGESRAYVFDVSTAR